MQEASYSSIITPEPSVRTRVRVRKRVSSSRSVSEKSVDLAYESTGTGDRRRRPPPQLSDEDAELKLCVTCSRPFEFAARTSTQRLTSFAGTVHSATYKSVLKAELKAEIRADLEAEAQSRADLEAKAQSESPEDSQLTLEAAVLADAGVTADSEDLANLFSYAVEDALTTRSVLKALMDAVSVLLLLFIQLTYAYGFYDSSRLLSRISKMDAYREVVEPSIFYRARAALSSSLS